MDKRVTSGIEGLDDIIGGGFPKGSTILVCGNPGTGKTVFSAQFLYKGAKVHGENGVYVSFGEKREAFMSFMKAFGFNFEKLEDEGKFAFLEMITGRKEIHSDLIKMILEKINDLNAERLVIDPITAISQAYEGVIDARTLIHTVLGKVVQEAGCTTLMVSEIPVGNDSIGLGVEEFVSDGVILLKRRIYNERLLRELEIVKLRGTRINYPRLTFTLDGGIHIFPPQTIFTQDLGRYEVIPHGENYYSTGISDLDKLIGGTFVKGGFNLIEVDADVAFPLERLTAPTMCNFLNQNHGVAVLPPMGLSAQTCKKIVEPHVDENVINRNLRIVDFKVAGEPVKVHPYVLPLKGAYIAEDMNRFWDTVTELRENTKKPVLTIVGYDTLEYIYGEKEALRILGEDIARIKNFEDLRVNIARPTIETINHLRALAHIHLKICQINGATLLYGVKPKTQIYNVEIKVENNVRKIRLKPIV
ncbi:AAA family ATPase [Candidatus Bathyarchaeota archaeon]|nr:AAA family ATPase [Candidatus Bathyarchaeota archaeon]